MGDIMVANISKICDYLDELYENPKCELNYNKDYELLIATVLSAQTTDKRVNMVTNVLFNKYPDLKYLKNADVQDIENIIRSIGSFRKKAIYVKEIAKILDEEYDGVVPNDRDLLIKMPGVGRKTANVVLSNIYDYPAIAVDTHVERVSKRLGLAYKNDDVLTVERKLMKKLPKDRWSKTHHQLVLFGRYNCRAIKPSCCDCKLINICKYYKNNNKNT